MNVFGTVRTTGDILNLGDVTILGSSSFETNGANLIIFSLTSAGNQALSINSGAVTVSGTVNDIGLNIINSGGVTFQNQVGNSSAVALSITNTTAGQNISFLNDANLSSLTTAAQGYGVSITGSMNTISSAVTFNNTGGIVLGNAAADSVTFTGGVTNSSSTVNLLGQVYANGASISLGNVDLGTGISIIDSTNKGASVGGANIVLGAVDGQAATLSVDAGTGGNSVVFNGSTNLLGLTTFAKNHTLSFLGSDNSITNNTIFNNTGALTFGDSANDSIKFSGNVVVNTATTINGTVATVGSNLTLQQVTIGEGGTATIETGGGALTVTGAIAGDVVAASENLVIDAGVTNLQNTVSLNSLTITGSDITLAQGANLTGLLSTTNSGLLSANGNVVAAGGVSTTGNVALAADVVTTSANVSIGGSLTLAENSDISIGTANGDVTISGSTQGTAGAGKETLTLNSGTGRVQLGDLFGAAGADDAGGLTDLTVTNSGAVTFNKIDIAGSLVQSNAATGNTVFGDVASLSSADLKGTNVTFSDFTSSGAVSVAASGLVTQNSGTKLTSAGMLSITASGTTFSDLAASTVSLNVTNDVSLTNTGNLALSGSVGRNLTLENQGSVNLTGSVGRDLSVSSPGEAISSTGLSVVGDSVFSGLDLSLSSLSATGDIKFTIDDDVVIQNSGSTVIDGKANSLDVTATAGTVTDSGDLLIDGLAKFSALGTGGSITLNNAGNVFGSLDLRSVGSVVVNESDSTQLTRVESTDFTLSAKGAVTDGASALIAISGTADIDTSGDLSLGNEVSDSVSLNILKLSAKDVVIGEDSSDGLTLSNINVDSLNISTGGSIGSVANANIIVTNAATFSANSGASAIQLVDSSNAFGSIGLTGSNIQISERDSMQLAQVTAAGDFSATVTGQVTDLGTVNVAGSVTINAGNQNVTLDSAANSFGELNITAGDAEIVESNGSTLNQISADQFVLSANGDIAQATTSEITVVGSTTLNSGSSNITLFGGSNNFGGLNISGDVVSISEASATRVEQATANQLSLTAAGNITQNNDGALNVSGLVTLNSGVSDITLGGDNNIFGSLNVTGQAVVIEESDGTNLVGLTSSSVVIDSVGSIVGTGALNVAGSSSFKSDTSNITLDNAGNQFGKLTLIGEVVSVVESGSVEMFEVTAGSLNVISNGGDISDATGATLAVLGNVVLSASGNITLGDSDNDAVTFGVVSLSGQEVNFREQGNSSISGITANNTTLVATGAISQQTGSTVTVTDLLSLSAGGSVTMDRGQNTFARLNLTSAANAQISNTAATVIDGLSTVGLTLSAGGDISDSTSVTTTGDTVFSTTGNITLDGEENSFGTLSLTGQSVTANAVSNLVLSRLDASSATLSSNQAISDTTNALISVSGQADFNARQNISLGSGGNNVQFDSVALAGGIIEVSETNSAQILDVKATNLDYRAGGEIVATGALDVSEGVVLTADEGDANISAINAGNSFSELFVDGADVDVVNSAATVLQEVDVDNLKLTSGGNVTDGNEDGIVVVGLAEINAGTGNITLGDADSTADNDSVSIGSVKLTGNQIDLTQLNGITIISLNVADDLILESQNGNITAATDASVQLVDDGINTVALTVGRNDGLIEFIADSAMGDVTASGLSVTLREEGNLTLDSLDAGSAVLSAAGSISDGNGATINVTNGMKLTAGTSVTLGGGIANFGTLNIEAASATIVEDSATVFSGLDISGDLTLNSVGSVTQSAGSSLVVGNAAIINVSGVESLLQLDGQFGALDLDSSVIDLTLRSDAMVLALVADTLIVDALGSQFSTVELGEISVAEQATILADQVTFGLDATNVFGGLDVSTSVEGSINIFSDVQSLVRQGLPSNPTGNFNFLSNNITLGAVDRDVTVATAGFSADGQTLGGSIVFSGIEVGGGAISSTGVLSLAGNTAVSTTLGGAAGASINLMSDTIGSGSILSTGDVVTTLTVSAGLGDIAVGDFVAGNEINNFTVTSGDVITLNDLFVEGNTVSVKVAGNVNANGVVRDAVGDVSLFTTGGNIELSKDVSSNGTLSLTADKGTLNTKGLTSGLGLNVSTGGKITFDGDVSIAAGDTRVTSADGSIETKGSFNSSGTTGNVSIRSKGDLLLGSSVESKGRLALSSTSGALTTEKPIRSVSQLDLAAGTSITVNQVDVTAGSMNAVSGSGNLIFNGNVNVLNNFTAFSLAGGFKQFKDTLIKSGDDLVISTQGGMDIASLSGGKNVTLSIRQTSVTAGADAPLFRRVNDAIPVNSELRDVQSGSGSISYLSQVASVGSVDPNQNFVQRAGGGIFYGLVAGQFFSDDIGASQILATAPTSVSSSLTLFTDANSGIGGLLAGDIFGGDFSAISAQIAQDFTGIGGGSTNAGQTTASSSSRSTAASQRDDEDEEDDVDEAAFQNLRNYDENPQGILLPADQQFAYDDQGNIYFMVAMQTTPGEVDTFPLFKVDLTLQPAAPVTVATFQENFPPFTSGSESRDTGADD